MKFGNRFWDLHGFVRTDNYLCYEWEQIEQFGAGILRTNKKNPYHGEGGSDWILFIKRDIGGWERIRAFPREFVGLKS